MGHFQVNIGGNVPSGLVAFLYSALWHVSVFDRAGAGADFDSWQT